ncbi:MAG: hypothetical protein AAB800_01695 [Patescibacteria group bacterium]
MSVEMEPGGAIYLGCTKCGMVIKTQPQYLRAAIEAHPHDSSLMVPLLDEEDARSRFGGGLMPLEIRIWPPPAEESQDSAPDEPLILDN